MTNENNTLQEEFEHYKFKFNPYVASDTFDKILNAMASDAVHGGVYWDKKTQIFDFYHAHPHSMTSLALIEYVCEVLWLADCTKEEADEATFQIEETLRKVLTPEYQLKAESLIRYKRECKGKEQSMDFRSVNCRQDSYYEEMITSGIFLK